MLFDSPSVLQRRKLLHMLFGSSSLLACSGLWAQTLAGSPVPAARLIVVFLRGAYDGLSALVPYGDANYYRLRPTIAIPAPNGSTNATLALDSQFGLHPALAPLLPLWQQGVLAAIPCAGSPDPTRSHFDAQRHWELGVPGKSSGDTGWLNTLAGMHSGTHSISVGEANPLMLAGKVPVQRVPKGLAATRQGAVGDARTRDAVMKLYAGQDALSQAFRAGADSRMQTAQTLSDAMATSATSNAEMLAANNGAGSAQGLLLDAQHLGTLMTKDRNLRFGFLSAGGWDTHANQGSVNGALAQSLASLARTLEQLRRDFSEPDDVVLVVSEFGRTSAENGTRGTDHGHGNAMWLMGSAVQGGRWHGRWDGLEPGRLHEARDLPVHHDFRAVLAQVLRAQWKLTPTALDTLFPGFIWDNALNGLMRA